MYRYVFVSKVYERSTFSVKSGDFILKGKLNLAFQGLEGRSRQKKNRRVDFSIGGGENNIVNYHSFFFYLVNSALPVSKVLPLHFIIIK